MDGLIVGNSIKKHGGTWATHIVKGEKQAEVRGNDTNKRGIVAIVEAGTNLILGTVNIYGSYQIKDAKELEQYKTWHLVQCSYDKVKYKNKWLWLMKDAVLFQQPIPCNNRKQGQVIWVKDAL